MRGRRLTTPSRGPFTTTSRRSGRRVLRTAAGGGIRALAWSLAVPNTAKPSDLCAVMRDVYGSVRKLRARSAVHLIFALAGTSGGELRLAAMLAWAEVNQGHSSSVPSSSRTCTTFSLACRRTSGVDGFSSWSTTAASSRRGRRPSLGRAAGGGIARARSKGLRRPVAGFGRRRRHATAGARHRTRARTGGPSTANGVPEDASAAGGLPFDFADVMQRVEEERSIGMRAAIAAAQGAAAHEVPHEDFVAAIDWVLRKSAVPAEDRARMVLLLGQG